MANTITLTTTDQRDTYIEAGGLLGLGLLLRDGAGDVWLAFDSEDGPHALRPRNEEDRPGAPAVLASVYELPLPLTVTTETD